MGNFIVVKLHTISNEMKAVMMTKCHVKNHIVKTEEYLYPFDTSKPAVYTLLICIYFTW